MGKETDSNAHENDESEPSVRFSPYDDVRIYLANIHEPETETSHADRAVPCPIEQSRDNSDIIPDDELTLPTPTVHVPAPHIRHCREFLQLERDPTVRTWGTTTKQQEPYQKRRLITDNIFNVQSA